MAMCDVCGVVTALFALLFGFVNSSPEMHALHDRLLGNYSVYVRPVRQEHHVTEVNLTMHLLNLLSLDLKAQTLKTSGYLDVVWHDEYLQWNPRDYANITEIMIPQTKVWLPDIMATNDVRGFLSFGNDRTLVHVAYNGMVTWQPDYQLETSCKADIFKYPFDQQECEVQIIPWIMTGNNMLINYLGQEAEKAVINSEFLLVETRLQSTSIPVTFSSADFTKGTFIVVLQRRSMFYVLSTVLPLVSFSLLPPLALLVPSDSGEKITLSVSVLLSNMVFMGTFADSIPRVGDSVSVFVLYSSMQILLSFAIVITNIILICLSRVDTEHDSDGVNEYNVDKGNESNTKGLCSMFRSLILSAVGASSKPYVYQDQLQPKHDKITTVQDSVRKLEFPNQIYSNSVKEVPSLANKTPASRKEKPSAIGRRDKQCFVGFSVLVLCANVATVVVLVI